MTDTSVDVAARAATSQRPAHTPEQAPESAPGTEDGLVLEDLLVEEVSIDGMCGVY